jgi:hypothetical protein
MRRHISTKLFAAAALALVVSACATPTLYQPATASDTSNGYRDYRIEPDRYGVSFSGNSVTSRETVERYLLFRAAELTLDRGYDWFTMADRQTERKSRTYVDQPFSSGPYGYWGPSWRYRGRGIGWRTWDPFWGDPFWDNQIDVHTVDRYEATAEIVLGRGPKPRDDRRVFDARSVIDNLRGSIRAPEDR